VKPVNQDLDTTNPMRILVVTDFGLGVPGGAQLVANNLMLSISEQGHICEFISYRDNYSRVSISSYLRRFGIVAKAFELRGILNPWGCLRFLTACRSFKPDVIWLHNINNEWSWSIALLGFPGAKKFITFHDLTAISRLKVEPKAYKEAANIYWKRNFTQRVRNSYIRFTLRHVKTIAIGAGVGTILQENQIRVNTTIPNTVEPCNHENLVLPRLNNSVLFAGRENLKGLAQIAKAVALEEDWVLYLAGDHDLLEKTTFFCPIDRIRYLGKLNHEDLLKWIHNVEYVAVLSQYFDNFPTIALEAIVHGAIPLTTSATGVSALVRQVGEQFVLEPGEIPNLSKMKLTISAEPIELNRLRKELSNRRAQVDAYLKLFYESLNQV